ncbi:helix-turn-helix transcriptional regulator [Phycicoccus avicenniae]|uniref:helix-turn-helix transcriptional regulator n=1 Tax=Phycicoccus avicenniae TaxID=2828860 RepID=UPI003D27BF4C
MEVRPVLVGREPEREALRAVIDRAASGEPGLLLVHGEAGIGKTSLVREAAEAAGAGGSHVLFGQCLRFGADVTSFLPFTQALGQWLRTTDTDQRQRLAPRGVVDDLVPALHDPTGGLALLQIGAAVDAIQSDGPTVLVVDDLQWSDPSSLDALSYLVAGFTAGQRLAVLCTYRDTELDDGHRLHGWVADALRMPSVSRVALDRMDAWTMEEMVLARGGPGRAGVRAEDVLRRSGGNPYLADLLIEEASTAQRGDQPRVGRLADALSASWHRLSPSGRKVTQLLAVAGAPVAFHVLQDLAVPHGVSPQEAARAVGEAATQGITIETASGAVWFRHPMLAETIAAGLRRQERADLHSDLAARWQEAVGVDERDRANFLALHHVEAGDSDLAFTWSLRAADEAATIRAREEEAQHLSTAVSLMPRLSDQVVADVDVIGLLTRAGRVCENAGDDRNALRHYEAALARVECSPDDPLTESRILLALHLVRSRMGDVQHLTTTEPRQVLALTEALPHSEERARAFAQLAFAEVFAGSDRATAHAESAVRLAEVVDTAPALVWAYGARAQSRWGSDLGVRDAQRAFAVGSGADDTQLFGWSALFLGNSLEAAGRYVEAADTAAFAYLTLRDAGAFDDAAFAGSFTTRWNLALGRWDETRPMVRQTLTFARSDNCAAQSRCAAALLCAFEGRRAAAFMHLRRAEELMPNVTPVGNPLIPARIQVYLAVDDPMGALGTIAQHMAEVVRVSRVDADEWLLYASQAAAQLADRPADSPERQAALRLLDLVEATRGDDPPPFTPVNRLDVVHPAFAALHAAQRAECTGAGAALDELWDAACAATAEAGLVYDQARAHYSLARHLLTRGHDRSRAARSLATARGIAADLGASPLLHRIDDLAAQSHIVLPPRGADGPGTTGRTVHLSADPPLTRREEEVLDGLLAGLTYTQIATRLFISDKTVSSHVSTILRKTGAANRIELAERARRGGDHGATSEGSGTGS